MKAEQLRRLSIAVMIASLIGAAVLAVIAVLAGSFGEIFQRALWTLVVVALHAFVSLMFVDQSVKKSAGQLTVFYNTAFILVILSFFTAIFGTWGILSGGIVGKLYMVYFVLFFASLHGEMLAQTLNKQRLTNGIVYANFVFMALVVLLLMPIIWMPDNDLGDFYYRLLAATGIVDATLTILAVILDRLYLQKHPKQASVLYSSFVQYDGNGRPIAVPTGEAPKRRIHPLLWLLGVLLVLQLIFGLIFVVVGALVFS